ncbi:hypothetical protein BDA96_04G363200 [Sorghum bicolor]|uniref:AT3G52170-like helix-turn-helix domain-containing protein n=1 Tax=Sorghum bicolor TaxID=4558 RepID=A0A921R8M4_SORBI|nr:hypothetical protein BDA96_04G363200 [Sorghum bicolor]
MQASARFSSSAAFRKVIAGVSSATTRSCYRTSRWKAHAAPLPAQEPPLKGQKRATKQERKVRIMEFVESYRASNEGKFPTIKNIRQQIGGGHYTVYEVLSEMKYNHTKLQLGNPKAAPLQGTVEVTEHPMQKVEARVLESQVSEQSMAEDDAEVAQHQGTVEVSENSLPMNKGKVDQFQGTESESFKDRMDKPDPGNQQREIEANKFNLKNSEKSLDANASNESDKSGSDLANEEKTHARDDNPKHEESANTGLLGSLKSFAYGIRNFWKNM